MGAAAALGNIGDPRAVEPLIGALRDSEEQVRGAAAEALGSIGDPRAVEPLIGALRDSDEHVRIAVVRAIERIRDQRGSVPLIEAIVPLIEAMAEDHTYTAFGALRDFGTLAVWPLIHALKRTNKEVCKRAAAVLGDIKDSRSVEPLIGALRDSDEQVRGAAAEALGSIGDPRAVEPLIGALRDSDEQVRGAAAEALGSIRDARAIEPLVTVALTDGTIQSRAVKSLESLGWKPINAEQNALIVVTNAKNASLREWSSESKRDCWEAVHKCGSAALKPLIAAALDNSSKDVQLEVVYSLSRISDQQVVEPLIAILRDSKSRVRYAAAEVLGGFGDPCAVEPLICALSDSDKQVRSAAAKALGKIGDPRAVEPLIKLLRDGDGFVRWSAASALGEIGDARAVEALLDALPEPSPNAPTLDYNVVRALGTIGDPRAARALIQCVFDHPNYTQETLKIIERMLERSASSVNSDVLGQISQLDGVSFIEVRRWATQSCIYTDWHCVAERKPCSTDLVRQLARQELIRRGEAEETPKS